MGSRHEEHSQRMLGRGSQPARCQARDKKGVTGAIQRWGHRDRHQGQTAFLHFRQQNGQCLEIREGGY